MADGVSPTDEAVRQAHERLLQDATLQFDRPAFTPPTPPDWLKPIIDFLESIAPILKWVFWIGAGLIVALIVYAIVRELLRLRAPRAGATAAAAAPEAEWRPQTQAALDLLAEADALADQGRYAEAAHLLLLRSVQDIERRQPRALRVSLTTREIAALKALPEAARPAFAVIGRAVERSLFGGAPVERDDFSECRRAYEAFALPEGWRA